MKEKIKKVLFVVILAIIISFGFFEIKRIYIANKTYILQEGWISVSELDNYIEEFDKKNKMLSEFESKLYPEKQLKSIKGTFKTELEYLKLVRKYYKKGKVKSEELINIFDFIHSLEQATSINYRMILINKYPASKEDIPFMPISYSNNYMAEIISYNLENGNEIYLDEYLGNEIDNAIEKYLKSIDLVIEKGNI